jgi:hypothetical protein
MLPAIQTITVIKKRFACYAGYLLALPCNIVNYNN